MTDQTDFLAACRDLLGDTYVLTNDADTAPFLTDWRDRFTGKALAVLRPATVEQVAGVCAPARNGRCPSCRRAAIRACVRQHSGRRRHGRRAVAGAPEQHPRARSRQPHHHGGRGLHFANHPGSGQRRRLSVPLSLAAEGSCTIGGNLATNAGGTAVLRYGNTRELCLGLEVVTPQGEIGAACAACARTIPLRFARLYIGAEGTLGVITARS